MYPECIRSYTFRATLPRICENGIRSYTFRLSSTHVAPRFLLNVSRMYTFAYVPYNPPVHSSKAGGWTLWQRPLLLCLCPQMAITIKFVYVPYTFLHTHIMSHIFWGFFVTPSRARVNPDLLLRNHWVAGSKTAQSCVVIFPKQSKKVSKFKEESKASELPS